MKNIGIVLMAVTMLMVSCSKEESLETGGSGGGGGTGGGGTGGGGVTGARLIKLTPSIPVLPTLDLTYDASNRMVLLKATQDLGAGNVLSSQTKLTRDAAGRIITEVATDDFTGEETVTNYVYENATSKKVKYGILTEDGFSYQDSLAFTYTGDLCTKVTFYTSTDEGETYDLEAEVVFRYDNRNNVVEASESYFDQNTLVPVSKFVYEYDTRVNPVYFKDDVLLLNSELVFGSPNNPVKLTYTVLDVNISIAQTLSYQYRSDNKPSKANGTYSNVPYTIDYSYK